MQAVILAGGLGTRLKAITGDLPKPLVPVQGKPFLEYQLDALRQHAVREFVFCVGYGAAQIQTYFGDGARWNVNIEYAVETELRGTAGALKGATSLLHDSFFVLNGDSFSNMDYAALESFHRAKHALATLAVRPAAAGTGNVMLDAANAVTAFREKAQAADTLWLNAGVYLFEKRMLDFVPADTSVSLEYEVFPRLVAAGERVLGYVFQDYFIDIGTPESYHRFQADLNQGRPYVVS